jgi:hypothetical protein
MFRPGALNLAFSGAVAIVAPLVVQVAQIAPQGEIEIKGPQAIPWLVVAITWYAIWLIGFVKYSRSKGYGGWLAFCLANSQLCGMVALFLLPDRTLDRSILRTTDLL